MFSHTITKVCCDAVAKCKMIIYFFRILQTLLAVVLLAPALESSPQQAGLTDYDYYYDDNTAVGNTGNGNGMVDPECVIDVGPLVRTSHRVKGKVCVVDINTILIENFQFDGLGAGVFINIGEYFRPSN